MAMAMREAAGKLIAVWRRHGCEFGFGAGIAQGYATLGQIGFSERSGYTAIGTVCNLAARLCAEAEETQQARSLASEPDHRGKCRERRIPGFDHAPNARPDVRYHILEHKPPGAG